MPRVMLNWVGQTVAGQYLVEARLGEGGMGTVYRAFDQRRQHYVALKVPRLALLENPAFFKRFQREMKALMGIRHAHLVPVLDVGEHNRIPFIAMKFLPGGSLRERFDKKRFTGTGDLFPWLRQIASALDFLHAEKLVHRDVKPDNVLFDEHGDAYLSDLGAMKVQEGSGLDAKTKLTETGTVLGTPSYMAPEVIFGKPYDGRADQYALGVMVYEAFTGRYPYPADSLPILVQALMGPEPERLDRLGGVPSAVADAVARAMDRDPARRFGTCTEFAEAVRLGFPAPTPSPSQPATSRPNPGNAPVLAPTQAAPLPTQAKGQGRGASRVQPSPSPVSKPGPAPAVGRPGVAETPPADPSKTAPVPAMAQTTPNQSLVPTKPNTPLTTPPTIKSESAWPGNLRQAKQLLSRPWLILVGLASVIGLAITLGFLQFMQDPRSFSIVNQVLPDLQPQKTVLEGHEGPVTSVAVTGDGRYIVSGSTDGTVRVWDFASGRETRRINAHEGWVRQVAVAPSGEYAASLGYEEFGAPQSQTPQSLRLWDLGTGKELRRFTESYTCVAITKDSKAIVIGGNNNKLILLDYRTGKQLGQFPCGSDGSHVHCVAITQDGKHLGACIRTKLYVFNINTKELVYEMDIDTEFDYFRRLHPLALSPDVRYLVLLDNYHSDLEILGVQSQQRIWHINEYNTTSIDFTPDGAMLVTGHNNPSRIMLYDLKRGTAVRRLTGHKDDLNSVAVCPNGKFIVSASDDKTIRIWDISKPDEASSKE